VAERSGDTAFGRTEIFLKNENIQAHESGVALRFPPQSMTRFLTLHDSIVLRRFIRGWAMVKTKNV
jgi:hypothetical protein